MNHLLQHMVFRRWLKASGVSISCEEKMRQESTRGSSKLSYKTNMQENAAAKVGLYHELACDCECKAACTISLADSNNPPCRTVQFIFNHRLIRI
ncbi:hypothetical protein EMCRGX_G005254 [Ephydatia muelleri]